QYAHLLRRQPCRERTGEVLDENRDEPLERSTHGAMDHDRTMRRVVLARVGEVEPLRIRVVELNRAELPRAPDGIRDVEVDLRPVECAVAFLKRVRPSRRLER